MLDYISRFKAWVLRAGQTRLLVAVFFALGLAGMVADGVRGAEELRHQLRETAPRTPNCAGT